MGSFYKSPAQLYSDYGNLQNLRAKDWGLHELVYFYSCIRILCDTYSNLEIDKPEWLMDKRREFARGIKAAQEDQARKDLGAVNAELEKMRSLDEQRADLEARRETLQTKIRG